MNICEFPSRFSSL